MSHFNTLQTLLNDAETQLAAIFAEKMVVLGLISDLDNVGKSDVASKSETTDGAGSTSFSYVTLNERLKTLIQVENDVIRSITSLKELVAMSGTGIIKKCFNY